MTVCIAVLFNWNYAKPGDPVELGRAAFTASDRMITAADVQYEPQQKKVAYFGKSIVLVAGDIGLHSQAIRDTEKEIKGRDLSPYDITQIYGRAVQSANRRNAENEILGPLGLNIDTFHAQQKDFSVDFVNTITSQFQNRRPIDSEALLVGSDGERAQIYLIDAYGNGTNLDGVGFGAVGIGAWHAKSRLMQMGHTSSRMFSPSLASIFAAKKNAEIAPGVGASTDIHLVMKDTIFPLWDSVYPEVERLYTKYVAEVSKLESVLVNELQAHIDKPSDSRNKAVENERPEGSTEQNPEPDGSFGADAAKTP